MGINKTYCSWKQAFISFKLGNKLFFYGTEICGVEEGIIGHVCRGTSLTNTHTSAEGVWVVHWTRSVAFCVNGNFFFRFCENFVFETLTRRVSDNRLTTVILIFYLFTITKLQSQYVINCKRSFLLNSPLSFCKL